MNEDDLPQADFDSGFRIMPTLVRLEQVQDMMPFKFGLPTWTPDGFTLGPDFRIMVPTYVDCMWAHKDGRRFGLGINRAPENIPYDAKIEAEGVAEVQVNGQPAVLLSRQKALLVDTIRNTRESIIVDDPSLVWRVGSLVYKLRTLHKSLTHDELIRIAESVQPPST